MTYLWTPAAVQTNTGRILKGVSCAGAIITAKPLIQRRIRELTTAAVVSEGAVAPF